MPAGVSCGGAERCTAVGHSPPRPAEARRTETVGNATSNCRWEGTENDEDTVLRTQYPTLAGLRALPSAVRLRRHAGVDADPKAVVMKVKRGWARVAATERRI